MSVKNFMSYGDAETVLTGFANAIKSKANSSDLGTAAAKDSTNSVSAGSTDLVESGAVKDAIDAAVASAYHHAGTKTVAQLTHDLLIAANEGNVYNITDSGTTTSDFIEGLGKQIDAGDNVGICKVGNAYMFDLLSGLEDTSIFVQKSQTSGLLKNDGTVNTTIEDTVAGHTTAITAIVNKYGAKNLLPNRAASQTLNGVTFTVNTDGSVTVNGTATARIDFNIARQDVDGFHLESGNYTINGCPADGGSESYHLLMSVNNTWGTKDVGQGVTVNGTIEAVVIRVMSGVTIDNKTFYPMVRDARISDDTYVPFVMTNKQLTDDVAFLDSKKADTDMVAADFNAGTSYTAGNYCVQDGKLYKFKNNHSGAWSVADVDEVKITGELSALKSGLNNVPKFDTIQCTIPNEASTVSQNYPLPSGFTKSNTVIVSAYCDPNTATRYYNDVMAVEGVQIFLSNNNVQVSTGSNVSSGWLGKGITVLLAAI